MDHTRWTIPLTAAATLHGVAFFGFHPSPTLRAGHDPDFRCTLEPTPLIEQIDEIPPPAGDPVAAGNPNPPPRGEDVAPPPRPDALTVPFEPPARLRPEHVARVIGGPGDCLLPGIGPGVGTWNGIPSVDQLDRVPRTRLQPSPVYPYEARKDGRAGEVVVTFTVDEEGRVVNPVVLRSSDPAFETPTLRAVSRWRFEPGRKNGRIVRFRLAVPVQFALND